MFYKMMSQSQSNKILYVIFSCLYLEKIINNKPDLMENQAFPTQYFIFLINHQKYIFFFFLSLKTALITEAKILSS